MRAHTRTPLMIHLSFFFHPRSYSWQVESFARDLYASNALLSVASGGMGPVVKKSLAATGLLSLFPIIVTADLIQRGKPDPEMFLLCAERMGVRPQDCLVLEDGQSGIDAAIAAGMDWVRVADACPDIGGNGGAV
eukprot:TRINITY_DN2905_c0_g1_i2.p2 TRINITY_DN2905_c0_g1~~TRINITY_DN2905_c0_g1_i2.p2  ORF type:complete len:135 (+),score=15.67 TRINITY_DN2905_c0_g1_i2:404-808(+)